MEPSNLRGAAEPPAKGPAASPIAWRQSLGAGLLLGLALGCAWLIRWTPRLYPRLLLVGLATLLALLGLAALATLAEGRGWVAALHRRIGFQWAGAGLTFISAVVVLALAAIATGNNLLYLVVSGLLAALVVSGAVSALNLSGMELRFRLPEEMFAGEPVPVQFRLTNAKSFWPSYSLTVSAATRAAADRGSEAEMRPVYFPYLARRASAAADSTIAFPRRGRYTEAGFVVATRFPFGLMQKRRRFQGANRAPDLLVFPAPLAGLQAQLQRRAGADAAGLQRGEGHELYRIRDHQSGDSAKQVHWKASARARQLQVREFREESMPLVRLRLSLPAAAPAEVVEAALSRCAGWIVEFSRPDLLLEFIGDNRTPTTGGLYLPPRPGLLHRKSVLEYLACVDSALPFADLDVRPQLPATIELHVP